MARMTDPQHDLFTFSFCGPRETCFESIHLKRLAELADEENWTSKDNDGHNFDILFYYIIKTFEIISKQNKISYSDGNDFALFNTGLLTENGEEIYGYFELNQVPDAQKWYFKGFAKESDRLFCNKVFNKPSIAQYDKNIEEFHFDSGADIELNADHIFDGHWDDDRFPLEVKSLGKQLAIASIQSAFQITKKKIRRNPRLAVPQYYDGKIMFLLPVKISVIGSKAVTMALAVEKMASGIYRANTIFDLPSAYKKARLMTKPESNWLIE